MTVLAVIFVFGLLVFVHELGHFSVAKLVGIRVYEFSIGFGPKLIKFTRGETKYNLRALPLGGFVRMAGMDEDEDVREMKKIIAEERGISVDDITEDEEVQIKNSLDDEKAFKNKSVLKRVAVIFAGSFNNFVLGFLLFFLIFFFFGMPKQDVKNPVIGQLIAGLPADKAGIKPNDRILAINGVQIKEWEQLTDLIHKNPNQKLALQLQRGSQKITKEVKTNEKDGVGLIGIYPKTVYERQPFVASLGLAASSFKTVFGEITRVLGSLFISKEAVNEIGGPVRIVGEIAKAAKAGIVEFLFFTGAISVNLGIFNMLPIPALDGSRVLFLIIEAVRGKPVDPNKENLVHLVGFALLMLLVAIISYRDVTKMFFGG